MNDCYSFQNLTGIGISDILESQTIEITNLIDITSNDLFDYTSNTSNNLFDYTSNINNDLIDFRSNTSNEIDALKQKDLSHDGSISSINSSIGTLQGQIGALDALTIVHSEQISILQATDIALSGSVAGLTATTVLLANDKVNKTSLDGISVIYRDDADNIQLKYNTTHFKESSLLSGNTREFKLNDVYANLPSTIPTDIANACIATSNNLINYNNYIASLLNF